MGLAAPTGLLRLRRVLQGKLPVNYTLRGMRRSLGHFGGSVIAVSSTPSSSPRVAAPPARTVPASPLL